MNPVLIDGVAIDPQPTSHEWDDRRIIGYDGNRFPIYAKYTGLTLSVPIAVAVNSWRQYVDGALHTITVPARDTANDMTQYTNVIVESVTHGAVERQTGMRNTEMRVISIVEP